MDQPLRDLAAAIVARWGGQQGSSVSLIAVAGPVAVGKSLLAEQLAEVMRRLGRGSAVVSADGFLLPNARLEAAGLMARKGFPESFDTPALRRFFAAVAAGAPSLTVPVYSHETYDVDGERTFDRPDVIVFEGVNALAWPFDYGVYLDADEADLEAWYVERFLALGRQHAPRLAGRLAKVGGDPVALARTIWREVNLVNLRDHIAPTRDRADAVVEKGPDHAVRSVSFR